MMKDKSFLTNLVASFVVLAGILLGGTVGDILLGVGLYALSGAITNWLAIHMLFEKVPGFYGSGVIPARFAEFKSGIRELVMLQFFNPDNVRQFFSQAGDADDGGSEALVKGMIAKVDFNKAFDELVEVILQSSFGNMLGMFGGPSALQPLREPFIARMQRFLEQTSEDADLMAEFTCGTSASLLARVENIVERRLEELTPQLVKEIIQRMIRKHLGWLVVWGGVVGGVIGLIVELLRHSSLMA